MVQNQKSPSKQENNANNPLKPVNINKCRISRSETISQTMHELMRITWGADFISPIKRGLSEGKNFKVLDVGCTSPGTWVLQIAEEYPLAQFIGLDNSSKLPDDFPQNNVQFIQNNIFKASLPFEDDSFDFVHMRSVLSFFAEEKLEEIVKELVRVCKPGGWIEITDFEETKPLGPSSKRLVTSFLNHLESKGICNFNEEIPETLESTDQIDTVYADERLIPIGKWGGDLGKLALKLFVALMGDAQILSWLGINKEKDRAEMMNQSIKEVDYYHTYFVALKICCQKII